MQLRSPHLDIIAATLEHVEAELQGHAALQSALGAPIPADWPPGEYDRDALEFFRARLAEGGPEMVGWLIWYAVVRSTDGAPATLVASAGFFGPPAAGAVEIGYSVVPAARGKGYATEIVAALRDFAFLHPAVGGIVAHTTRDNIPSWRALLRCGFEENVSTTRPGALEYILKRPVRAPAVSVERIS